MSKFRHQWPTKHEDATYPYTFDVTQELASGETVSSVSWTVPSALTNNGESNDTTTCTVTLSGGTSGQLYEVEADITTSDSNVIKKIAALIVRNNA